MEGSKPSWRTAWSVGTDEKVKPSWRGLGPLDRWKGRPARSPGCGRWLGFWPAPGFENSRDGLGTTRRYVLSGLNRPFPRSIDKIPTSARGAHQATAPSTQLVGCDGDWPACRALSDSADEKVKPAGARHGPWC
jgi:hypothetical protein